MNSNSTIRDPALWEAGEGRIRWAVRHSPVLRRLAASLFSDGALRGRRLALVIHLGPKTAYLARLLTDAGAEVVAVSSNPGSVHDDVAAALAHGGVTVHAVRGCSTAEWEGHVTRAIEFAPELIIDDGAELVTRLLDQRPDLAGQIIGSSEETTTGVHRLKALEAAGRLTWPAIAANTARCKHLFDNRYGTGQSAVTAILRATNLWLGGKTVVVAGYGWVGRGVADYASGLGAQVVVAETDPVRALEAHTHGYQVASLSEAAGRGNLFITCTGNLNVVDAQHLAAMRDGALLANAGHHAREINVAALEAQAAASRQARPNVTEYTLRDGRRLYLLARGQVVNLTAGEGHPVEIMDLTFAVQASALHYLATHAGSLPAGVNVLPPAIDEGIARAKLESLGIGIDRLTPAQTEFMAQWQ